MERFHVHRTPCRAEHTSSTDVQTSTFALRKTQQKTGGWFSVLHLPFLVSPSGITTFCFMCGFTGFSGYNVASLVKACRLCPSEREGKSSTSWKNCAAQERGQFLPDDVLQCKFQQMSQRGEAAARQQVKH